MARAIDLLETVMPVQKSINCLHESIIINLNECQRLLLNTLHRNVTHLVDKYVILTSWKWCYSFQIIDTYGRTWVMEQPVNRTGFGPGISRFDGVVTCQYNSEIQRGGHGKEYVAIPVVVVGHFLPYFQDLCGNFQEVAVNQACRCNSPNILLYNHNTCIIGHTMYLYNFQGAVTLNKNALLWSIWIIVVSSRYTVHKKVSRIHMPSVETDQFKHQAKPLISVLQVQSYRK